MLRFNTISVLSFKSSHIPFTHIPHPLRSILFLYFLTSETHLLSSSLLARQLASKVLHRCQLQSVFSTSLFSLLLNLFCFLLHIFFVFFQLLISSLSSFLINFLFGSRVLRLPPTVQDMPLRLTNNSKLSRGVHVTVSVLVCFSVSVL